MAPICFCDHHCTRLIGAGARVKRLQMNSVCLHIIATNSGDPLPSKEAHLSGLPGVTSWPWLSC